MTQALSRLALATLLAVFAAMPLSAECYADYKAKQDNPLRLQYGVIQLSDDACSDRKLARREIADRLARGGWQLLNVLSVFGADGLDQRRDSAGPNFLRY